MASATSPGLTILDLDIKELENAVQHLQRSNEELEEYSKTEKSQVILDAIAENQRAIKSKQAKITELKLLLSKGTASLPTPNPTTFTRPETSATTTTKEDAHPEKTEQDTEEEEEEEGQPASIYL